MSRTSLHTHGCRISDEWSYRGLRAAILENELLRIVVLLDRGAEIVEFRYKPLDLDPLLRLPREIRNPHQGVPSIYANSSTYLDYYVGGWQEILPNGGPPVTYKGVEYGQHGEISLAAWSSEVIDEGPDQVALCCWVRGLRTPLRVERVMRLLRGSAVLHLEETVTNEAGEPLDFMWGHHVAFGLPFLAAGAKIATSAQTLIVHDEMVGFEPRRLKLGQRGAWSHAEAADGSMLDMSMIPAQEQASGREMAYLTDFQGDAWYAVTSASNEHAGFAMRWDADVFRYLWLWQELSHATGYPWWGRVHAVALEPWTGYPTNGLNDAIARGTQRTLQAGESLSTTLTASMYAGLDKVTGVREDGSAY